MDEHFHRYRRIEAKRCDVPPEILLSAGRFDAAGHEHSEHAGDDCHDALCDHGHGDDHTRTFSTWCYETDRELSLEALREIASHLPANIYRCKGVVNSADAPGRRAVLQVVRKRVDLTLDDEWGEWTPRTQVVAIGAHGTVNGQA